MRRIGPVLLILLLAAPVAMAQAPPEPLARIPFERVGSHLFIEAAVNGVEGQSFVFDTGAGGTVLGERAAARIGIRGGHRVLATGAGGKVPVRRSAPFTFRAGAFRLERTRAVIAPLEHLSERIGRSIDGIIGHDVLDGHRVLLDYDRGLLEVWRPDELDLEDWGEGCRLDQGPRLQLNIPVVRGAVTLEGGEAREGAFFLDSGAGLHLILNAPFVEKHALTSKVGPTYLNTSLSLSDKRTASVEGRVEAFSFCGHSIPEVPTRLSRAADGVEALPTHAGIIGNEILRRFNAVYDVPGDRVYLRPNRAFGEPLRVDGSGLKLIVTRDEIVQVDEVLPGSPAEAAGLEPGDQILAVDDRPVAELGLPSIRDALKSIGRTVRFDLRRDGSAMTVSLVLRSLYGAEPWSREVGYR